jgi:acetyltransferase-like isoleucine patch superfamily enzyme
MRGISRLADVAVVLVKNGFADLAERLDLPGRREKLESLEGERLKRRYSVWARLRMVAEDLGPTFVKLGQLMSQRPDLLPADLVYEFRKLQDQVAPEAPAVIRQAVDKALGRPLEEVFGDFSPEPLASASLAQVHRARRIDDGRWVAVKVRRPGIIPKIEADLALLAGIVKTLSQHLEFLENYDLPGLVALAKDAGLAVRGVECGDDEDLMGVNSPLELTEAEERLRARIVRMWLARGVMIHRPELAVIGPRVVLAPGCRLHGPCELYGATRLARGAAVESHCVLLDSELAENARVRSFCHLEQAQVGADCVAGPYARLRPGAVLGEKSRVGNFVEVKKSVLGKGAKAGHLTYLGDAEIGPGVNVGAGTITCNYDGAHKHRTVIEDEAFIGSDTQLVAPVTVKRGATIGAGSTITKDAPEGELTLSRAKQLTIPGWKRPTKNKG